MKTNQRAVHLLASAGLRTPGVARLVDWWLTRVHVDAFRERSRRDEDARTPRFRAVSRAGIDAYQRALREGYPEARARNAAHVMANVDFYRLGWTELLDVPPRELEAHVERYAGFFDRHGVSLARPFGEFTPAGGLPDAPATPGVFPDPPLPNADAGYADDVYVDAPALAARKTTWRP